MEIEGRTCTKKCVVIPIDNEEGTIVDAYEGKIDGIPSWKPLDDVQLNLTAFEFKEKKYGQTHGVKAQFSRRRMEKMTEDQLRSMPFVGNMKPWVTTSAAEDDDLPIANEREDW